MKRPRVLAIDDEDGIRKYIARALEPSFEVILAADGLEGLRQAAAAQPQLILLDIHLPGLDGLGVLARLKTSPQTSAIPVVIVSVAGQTDILLEAQQGGAADHVIKPFTVDELRRVVQRNLLPDLARAAGGDASLPESIEGVALRPTVLVIEDEEGIRALMQRALSDRYTVATAADGLEGVAQARQLKPRLIFLDLRMPGLDGLGVLAKLKADTGTRDIPVVIASARGETDLLLEGQRSGAADYLIKPFQIEELRSMAKRHLPA